LDNEVGLKQERRKAATLARELEQSKFSADANTRDTNELIIGLKNKVESLKKENGNLSSRLEKNLKENQKKMEEERKKTLEIKEL